jgi:hypothetical protein
MSVRQFALCEAPEPVESALAPSTSGRVNSSFWDERRRRRGRAWSSPTLYLINVRLPFSLPLFFVRASCSRSKLRGSCAVVHLWVLRISVLLQRSSGFQYCELEQGRKLEENVSIDVKHSG